MKKVKLSLAALTLVLAVAGTTSVNATRSNVTVDLCSIVDPTGTECLDQTDQDCCYSEDLGRILTTKYPIIPPR